MKKSELKQLIRECIKEVLTQKPQKLISENVNIYFYDMQGNVLPVQTPDRQPLVNLEMSAQLLKSLIQPAAAAHASRIVVYQTAKDGKSNLGNKPLRDLSGNEMAQFMGKNTLTRNEPQRPAQKGIAPSRSANPPAQAPRQQVPAQR